LKTGIIYVNVKKSPLITVINNGTGRKD